MNFFNWFIYVTMWNCFRNVHPSLKGSSSENSGGGRSSEIPYWSERIWNITPVEIEVLHSKVNKQKYSWWRKVGFSFSVKLYLILWGFPYIEIGWRKRGRVGRKEGYLEKKRKLWQDRREGWAKGKERSQIRFTQAALCPYGVHMFLVCAAGVPDLLQQRGSRSSEWHRGVQIPVCMGPLELSWASPAAVHTQQPAQRWVHVHQGPASTDTSSTSHSSDLEKLQVWTLAVRGKCA